MTKSVFLIWAVYALGVLIGSFEDHISNNFGAVLILIVGVILGQVIDRMTRLIRVWIIQELCNKWGWVIQAPKAQMEEVLKGSGLTATSKPESK